MDESLGRISPEGRGLALPAKVVVSLRAGAVLALANVICVIILSTAWVHVRSDPKNISVTGSAKKPITSDLIVWTARISAQDPTLQHAYETLSGSLTKTLAYLKQQGIAGNELKVGSIATQKHHERDAKGNETDKITSYELVQDIEITSGNVARVSTVARTVTDLISEDVMLESDPPRYLYTKLADLKVSMLAEATRDATNRAQQIASNSNARLGKIIDAKMGVMQINAANNDDVSGAGVNDTSSLEKEITAVVTARFSLQ